MPMRKRTARKRTAPERVVPETSTTYFEASEQEIRTKGRLGSAGLEWDS